MEAQEIAVGEERIGLTIKDLQKLIANQQPDHEDEKMEELKRRLYERPFWIWSSVKHKEQSNVHNNNRGYCCFNHIIGLPKKDGQEFPLFNYENMLFNALTIPGHLNSRPGGQYGREG